MNRYTLLPESGDRSGREVCVVAGTRPEAVKMAPVVMAMRASGRLRPTLVDTGQHPEMVPQALRAFDLTADVTLRLRRSNGGLAELAVQLLDQLDHLFQVRNPACVVVQGDTATTLAAALAAFWRKIPVVHLEAGLRSHDLNAPFPEEGNRKLVTQIASLHLTPTASSARNLGAEARLAGPVLTIGNTVVDAVIEIAGQPCQWQDGQVEDLVVEVEEAGRRLVLVTAHRRESWGAPLDEVLRAVRELVRRHQDVRVLFAAHPNPAVREQVDDVLGSSPAVTVTGALPYGDLVRLLPLATLVLSDSGGIQEEAPAFGTPVLVLREVTERTEAIERGCALLVGTAYQTILDAADHLLHDEQARAAMTGLGNPFGDGRAAERTEQAIAWMLGLQAAPPTAFAAEQTTTTSKVSAA